MDYRYESPAAMPYIEENSVIKEFKKGTDNNSKYNS